MPTAARRRLRPNMSSKRVTPKEAFRLSQEEGYTIVDVRSVEEFVEGHPRGAYNLPFLKRGPMGMVTNADFEARFRATFPAPGSKVILSCASGPRSARAQSKLLQAGYTDVLDMQAGLLGEADEEGEVVVPGWKAEGLPVEFGDAPPGRNYRDLGGGEARAAEPPAAAPSAGHGQGHGHEHGAPPAVGTGTANRYADPSRTVVCVKLKAALPALRRRPYPGAFGAKLLQEVSAEAWAQWVEHSKMLINEYRMNPIDPKAQEMLEEQCRAYFYGEGVARPEGYVPAGPGSE